MTEIRSFRDIIAWQRAVALGRCVYANTRGFPDDERYGLSSQIRRSVVSIASNIAEGYGRESTTDYIRFLKMARGSLYEVDTQLVFAGEFEYASSEDLAETKALLDETERVLAGLIRSLERTKRP